MTGATPVPFEVKAMNAAASVLFAGVALTALAAAGWWALSHPVFAIGGITVQGDVQRNSAVTLRANVAPRLAGNFFTLDLAEARAVFESVPWVRTAEVRREFPNRLRVLLREHEPVAYWGGEGESRLLNSFGEVFEANPGDVESDELPRLVGADGQAAQVLAMHRALSATFAVIDARLDQLELTARGNWRAQLDSGAVIELGRGRPDEVAQRAGRFAHTLTQVASSHRRTVADVQSADLRHANGYALRLRGVTTGPASAAGRT